MASKILKTFIAAALVAAVTPMADGASIINIASGNVTASSEISGFNRIDDHIVNGNGLTGTTHTNYPANGNMWLSTGDGRFGGTDTDPFVLFDLGAFYEIESFQVWNYNELDVGGFNGTARGVNAVTVEYGDTAALGSTVAGITNFAKADATATYAGEIFNTFTPFTARYIKFDIDSNHGGDNNFYGLSEVRFTGTLVPSPTAALAGLVGLSGLLCRRRRG